MPVWQNVATSALFNPAVEFETSVAMGGLSTKLAQTAIGKSIMGSVAGKIALTGIGVAAGGSFAYERAQEVQTLIKRGDIEEAFGKGLLTFADFIGAYAGSKMQANYYAQQLQPKVALGQPKTVYMQDTGEALTEQKLKLLSRNGKVLGEGRLLIGSADQETYLRLNEIMGEKLPKGTLDSYLLIINSEGKNYYFKGIGKAGIIEQSIEKLFQSPDSFTVNFRKGFMLTEVHTTASGAPLSRAEVFDLLRNPFIPRTFGEKVNIWVWEHTPFKSGLVESTAGTRFGQYEFIPAKGVPYKGNVEISSKVVGESLSETNSQLEGIWNQYKGLTFRFARGGESKVGQFGLNFANLGESGSQTALEAATKTATESATKALEHAALGNTVIKNTLDSITKVLAPSSAGLALLTLGGGQKVKTLVGTTTEVKTTPEAKLEQKRDLSLIWAHLGNVAQTSIDTSTKAITNAQSILQLQPKLEQIQQPIQTQTQIQQQQQLLKLETPQQQTTATTTTTPIIAPPTPFPRPIPTFFPPPSLYFEWRKGGVSLDSYIRSIQHRLIEAQQLLVGSTTTTTQTTKETKPSEFLFPSISFGQVGRVAPTQYYQELPNRIAQTMMTGTLANLNLAMGRPTRIGTARKGSVRMITQQVKQQPSNEEVGGKFKEFMRTKRPVVKLRGKGKEIVTSKAVGYVPSLQKSLRIAQDAMNQAMQTTDDYLRKTRLRLSG
jgi:hypothetical protein